MDQFKPNGRPVLVGSLPLKDHEEAFKLMQAHTPEIPSWAQLPAFPQEGMIRQFLNGFPGFCRDGDKVYIDTAAPGFEADLLQFYEAYLGVSENPADLEVSRFALDTETAPGFFVLKENLKQIDPAPAAVKGQITGPITFGTGVTEKSGRAIFYNDELRDAMLKHLALKARWQIRQLSPLANPVIIFIDEPGLAGFGSSAFISISREEISACLGEVIEAIHADGGLAGIHVCANTDWSLVLESPVDIVNFDAYAYFEKFLLYPDQIVRFLESGRILAWGIVPTLNPDDVEKESTETLLADLETKFRETEKLGIDRERLLAQALIAPACGAGSLRLDLAQKVLRMTKEISARIRDRSRGGGNAL